MSTNHNSNPKSAMDNSELDEPAQGAPPRNKPSIICFSHPNPPHFPAKALPKNITGAACSGCLQSSHVGIKLRRCTKCKAVWYCSVECQRKDWPKHKELCAPVEDSGTAKLVQKFLASILLSTYLHICVALKMDLVKKPTRGPFLVTVHIGVEPNFTQLLELIMMDANSSLPEEKIEGMFQINSVTIADPSIVLTPQRMDLWRQVREDVDKSGHRSDPVGFVQFVKGMSAASISSPFHIPFVALKIAKQASPLAFGSAMTGNVTEVPLTPNSCIRYINTRIRSDKKNEFSLRKTMSAAELQVIRDVKKENLPKESEAAILRQKMDTDPSYQVYGTEVGTVRMYEMGG